MIWYPLTPRVRAQATPTTDTPTTTPTPSLALVCSQRRTKAQQVARRIYTKRPPERDERWSYIDKCGAPRGPMTWAYLQARHHKGTFDDATLVLSERLSGGFSRAVDIDMRGPEPFSLPATPTSYQA